MAVGAGSIKRASKLNAEAVEQKMQIGKELEETVTSENVVLEQTTSDNAAPKKKTTKRTSAKKKTAKADSTEKNSANTVVVEETSRVVKNKNEACQLTQNLPIHLL